MARKTTPYTVKDFPKKPKSLKKPKKKVRWEMDEPKGVERINLYKKCPTCILVPPKSGDDLTDPSNYKFPVCTKLSKSRGQCQFNCTGVLAANRRARLTKKYPKVVALTSKLIEKWQCTKKAEKEAALAKPKRKTLKPKKKTVVSKKRVVKKVKTNAASKPKKRVYKKNKPTTSKKSKPKSKPKKTVVPKKKNKKTVMKPKKK